MGMDSCSMHSQQFAPKSCVVDNSPFSRVSVNAITIRLFLRSHCYLVTCYLWEFKEWNHFALECLEKKRLWQRYQRAVDGVKVIALCENWRRFWTVRKNRKVSMIANGYTFVFNVLAESGKSCLLTVINVFSEMGVWLGPWRETRRFVL